MRRKSVTFGKYVTAVSAAALIASPLVPSVSHAGESGAVQNPVVVPSIESLMSVYGFDARTAQQVAEAIPVRAQMGFATDVDFVAQLYLHPETAAKGLPEFHLAQDEYDEFVHRQALASDAQKIDQALSESELSSSYAGQWMDQLGGGRLVVLVLFDDLEKARSWYADRLANEMDQPDRIDFRGASVSMRDLRTAQERMVAQRDHSKDGSDVSYVGSDVSANQLVLGLEPTSTDETKAYWSEFMNGIGLPYRIEYRQKPKEASWGFASDPSTPPYYAGHGVTTSDNTTSGPAVHANFCTLGFKVTRTSAPNQAYLLSAAHCFINEPDKAPWQAPIDSKVYYNYNNSDGGTRTTMGLNSGYYATQQFDLSLIHLGQSVFAKIITDANPNNYNVVKAVAAYLPDDTFTCETGAKSNMTHCGQMTDWDNGDRETVTSIDGLIGGDSGGPLYQPKGGQDAWAIGITRSAGTSVSHSSNLYRYLHTFCSDCNVAVQ